MVMGTDPKPVYTWVQKVKLALNRVQDIQLSNLTQAQKNILIRAAKQVVVHEKKD